MKVLIALLIFLCAPQDAWALKKFDPKDREQQEELKEVRDAAAEGRNLDAKLATAKIALENAKTRQEATADYQKRIEELEYARQDYYNKAIWLTIRAYEILTPDQELPSVTMLKRSPNKGKKVTWVPIFDDHSLKVIVNEKG